MTERELLLSGLEQLGLSASPQAVDDLLCFSALLLEKNKVMNLTAVTDPREVVTRHFLDCAALAPQLQPGGRVLDVGTGAGFPGLPLAVLCPQSTFVLLDAQRKRIDFLSDVIAALGLSNCTAVHARAEDGGRDPALRERFDCATARAVAGMNVLSEYCLPFVKTGGVFAALKGPQMEEELPLARKAISVLGGKVERVETYALPGGDRRALALVRKSRPTPKAYPRQGGKIKKSPL